MAHSTAAISCRRPSFFKRSKFEPHRCYAGSLMRTCSKCDTQVDAEFEVCWRCGTTAEGVEDPAFLPADLAGPLDDPAEDRELEPFDEQLEDFAESFPELVDCYEAFDTIEARFVADHLSEQGIPAV